MARKFGNTVLQNCQRRGFMPSEAVRGPPCLVFWRFPCRLLTYTGCLAICFP